MDHSQNTDPFKILASTVDINLDNIDTVEDLIECIIKIRLEYGNNFVKFGAINSANGYVIPYVLLPNQIDNMITNETLKGYITRALRNKVCGNYLAEDKSKLKIQFMAFGASKNMKYKLQGGYKFDR